MVKKFITGLLIFTSVLFMFTGCNESIGWGSFSFNRAHISIGTKDVCVEVESWHDNELGCELKLKNGTSIYCAEGTYILIDGVCPICGK